MGVDAGNDSGRVATQRVKLSEQRAVASGWDDGDHPAPRLAGKTPEERHLGRVEGIGHDEHDPQPGEHGLVDCFERGQGRTFVANAQCGQPLPGTNHHVDQRRPNGTGITGERLQRCRGDMGGAQRHGHVDECVDGRRVIADTAQRERAVVAAQHRCDCRELQLGGDGAHRADRRVDQLDGQVDRGEEADAGDATGHAGQQATQGRRRGPGRNDHGDLAEPIITL